MVGRVSIGVEPAAAADAARGDACVGDIERVQRTPIEWV